MTISGSDLILGIMVAESELTIVAVRAAECDFEPLLDNIETAAADHWRSAKMGAGKRKWYADRLDWTRDEGEGLVALRAGEAHGFVAYHVENTSGVLDALYVPQDENRGLVAHRLLETAIAELRERADVRSIENRFFAWPEDYLTAPLTEMGFTVVQRADMILTLSDRPLMPDENPPGTLAIRPLGECDVSDITRCVHASYRNGEDPVYSPDGLTLEGTEAKVKALLNDCDYRYSFAAMDGTVVVGIALVCKYDHDDAYSLVLQDFCTDPAYRGRGIGAGLLTRLLNDMSGAGEKDVMLTVTLSNRTAIRCYEKFGFRHKRTVPYARWLRNNP